MIGDGNISAFNTYGQHTVVVGHPELVKSVLSGHILKFNKVDKMSRLKFFLGDGLLSSSGDKWKSHRLLIDPLFQSDRLQFIIPIVNQQLQLLVKFWLKMMDNINKLHPNTNKIVVNMKNDMHILTLNIICLTTCSHTFPSDDDREVFSFALNTITEEMADRMIDRPIYFYLINPTRAVRTRAAVRHIKKIVDDHISDRIIEHQNRLIRKRKLKEQRTLMLLRSYGNIDDRRLQQTNTTSTDSSEETMTSIAIVNDVNMLYDNPTPSPHDIPLKRSVSYEQQHQPIGMNQSIKPPTMSMLERSTSLTSFGWKYPIRPIDGIPPTASPLINSSDPCSIPIILKPEETTPLSVLLSSSSGIDSQGTSTIDSKDSLYYSPEKSSQIMKQSSLVSPTSLREISFTSDSNDDHQHIALSDSCPKNPTPSDQPHLSNQLTVDQTKEQFSISFKDSEILRRRLHGENTMSDEHAIHQMNEKQGFNLSSNSRDSVDYNLQTSSMDSIDFDLDNSYDDMDHNLNCNSLDSSDFNVTSYDSVELGLNLNSKSKSIDSDEAKGSFKSMEVVTNNLVTKSKDSVDSNQSAKSNDSNTKSNETKNILKNGLSESKAKQHSKVTFSSPEISSQKSERLKTIAVSVTQPSVTPQTTNSTQADKISPTSKLRTPGLEPLNINPNNESPLSASVRKIQRSPSSTLNKKTDLLDLLINSSKSSDGIAADDIANTLSKSDIRDQILTFLLAGYDKTSSSVLWVIYELCIHPDIQARCHAEIDLILRNQKYKDHNQGNPFGYMDFYAINKFTYMIQVIKETLRLHPVIGTISRQCHTDCDVGAYRFKAGTTVLASLVALHRHSEYWDNPLGFNPDRFAKENLHSTIKHPFQYVPLGKGQTQCTGQNYALFEILCIMGSLLSRFSFSLPTKDINAIVEEEMYTIEPKNLNVIVSLRL